MLLQLLPTSAMKTVVIQEECFKYVHVYTMKYQFTINLRVICGMVMYCRCKLLNIRVICGMVMYCRCKLYKSTCDMWHGYVL